MVLTPNEWLEQTKNLAPRKVRRAVEKLGVRLGLNRKISILIGNRSNSLLLDRKRGSVKKNGFNA